MARLRHVRVEGAGGVSRSRVMVADPVTPDPSLAAYASLEVIA
jgi:hypothetical protein